MNESNEKEFKTFKDFYPFYLSQHQNTICKRLHFVGSSLIVFMLIYMVLNSAWQLIWTLPLIGYGFAWVGHFFFEKNKPATFTYPIYSLIGDWVMFKDILLGKLKL